MPRYRLYFVFEKDAPYEHQVDAFLEALRGDFSVDQLEIVKVPATQQEPFEIPADLDATKTPSFHVYEKVDDAFVCRWRVQGLCFSHVAVQLGAFCRLPTEKLLTMTSSDLSVLPPNPPDVVLQVTESTDSDFQQKTDNLMNLLAHAKVDYRADRLPCPTPGASNSAEWPKLYIGAKLFGQGLEQLSKAADEGALLQALYPYMRGSLHEKLDSLITQKSIVIFMKGDRHTQRCKFSKELMANIEQSGLKDYATFNILLEPQVREGLKQYKDRYTYPHIYVDGKLFGGIDEMRHSIEASGSVDGFRQALEALRDGQ